MEGIHSRLYNQYSIDVGHDDAQESYSVIFHQSHARPLFVYSSLASELLAHFGERLLSGGAIKAIWLPALLIPVLSHPLSTVLVIKVLTRVRRPRAVLSACWGLVNNSDYVFLPADILVSVVHCLFFFRGIVFKFSIHTGWVDYGIMGGWGGCTLCWWCICVCVCVCVRSRARRLRCKMGHML